MKRIWAPWRAKYIQNCEPQGECIFCHIPPDPQLWSDRLILHLTERSVAMMNLYPYTNGHILVAPLHHEGSITALGAEELLDLFQTVQVGVEVLQRTMAPHGLNIGLNLGKVAGAGVEDHLHVQVVPRWHGDTNFMPVLADARVISENIHVTYERLRAGFQDLVRGK